MRKTTFQLFAGKTVHSTTNRGKKIKKSPDKEIQSVEKRRNC
jgi:hypothetical protein